MCSSISGWDSSDWRLDNVDNACSWASNMFYDLTCTNDGQYITRIRYSFMESDASPPSKLRGTLPASLANLTMLNYLAFDGADFQGTTIPSVIFTDSPSLAFLSLERSNLTGTLPNTISPSIRQVFAIILFFSRFRFFFFPFFLP
jgi:hypothetical protein